MSEPKEVNFQLSPSWAVHTPDAIRTGVMRNPAVDIIVVRLDNVDTAVGEVDGSPSRLVEMAQVRLHPNAAVLLIQQLSEALSNIPKDRLKAKYEIEMTGNE